MGERMRGPLGKARESARELFPGKQLVNRRSSVAIKLTAQKKQARLSKKRTSMKPIVTHYTDDAILIGDLPMAGDVVVANSFPVLWMVDFKLPRPAKRDGYIYQRVKIQQRGTFDYDSVYYEAWRVRKGKTTVDWTRLKRYWKRRGKTKIGLDKFEDRFGTPALPGGEKGVFEIWGRVVFYEGPLPSTFRPGKLEEAGNLPATRKRPAFWNWKDGVKRHMRVQFDTTSSDRANWKVTVEARIFQNGRISWRKETREGFDKSWWEIFLGL